MQVLLTTEGVACMHASAAEWVRSRANGGLQGWAQALRKLGGLRRLLGTGRHT